MHILFSLGQQKMHGSAHVSSRYQGVFPLHRWCQMRLYSMNREVYRKIGILSTSAYFEISSQNGYLFSRGAYFCGVLINPCNFLVACSCVGMD